MWNIAHRGASGQAPENTLAAFRLAIAAGARHIETDLRITKDGRVVAMHDVSLLRTTGVPMLVRTRTLQEIRKLSAGRWFASRGRKFRRERVPTLIEVLRFGGAHRVTLYLELKNLPDRGLEEAVVSAIQSERAKRRVVVISFHDASLRKVKELDAAIQIGLLDKLVPREVILHALAIGAPQVLARADKLTPKLIGEIREAGLKAIAWTVNDPNECAN